jgi:2-hydroxychromene-2-carboxylate isomerase
MQLADGTLTEAVYLLNQENAVAADVFGSPAYTLDGEVFWGQDRLEFLDQDLASGRPAYRPFLS